MTFEPSKYQQAAFDFVTSGQGDGLINAVAGSGKSTTLVKAAELLPNDKEALFCAFNRHIALALGEKLKDTPMQARTIHSLGLQAISRHYDGKVEVDDYKYSRIVREVVKTRWLDPSITSDIKRLTTLARVTLTPNEKLHELAYQHNIYENVPLIAKLVPIILEIGLKEADRLHKIDFADMIWLPNKLNMEIFGFDWVFVDESQDLSAAQLEIVMKLRNNSGRMLFVGDPRQSIMSFAGADSQAFWKIKDRTGATELPLSICYRCPTTHIELAQSLVPYLEARDNAPPGSIEHVTNKFLDTDIQEEDMVLCRTTAPLIKLCLELIQRKVAARVRGRDIGKDLSSLVHKVQKRFKSNFSYDSFGSLLEDYVREIVIKLSEDESNEAQIESLNDRAAAIQSCYTYFPCHSIEELCQEIENLFSDERSSVWLSTVHRAKGLENHRIIIIHPEKLPLTWKNQSPEQLEQENNLKYVAFTRSTDQLIFVD